VNVDGTKNVLAASQEADVKAFVYTSSSSVVVGDVDNVSSADETWPVLTGTDQPEYYTRTKAIAETAVLEANRSSPNFLTCSIRPAAIFGDGDPLTLTRMLLNLGFKARFQLGDNNNLFDWTYVKNVAHGHLLAVEALLQTASMDTVPLDHERVDGEAFFITNGTPFYFFDFFRRVHIEAGSNPKDLDPKRTIVLPTGFALLIAAIAEFVLGIFGKQPNITRFAVRSSTMRRFFSIDKARARLRYEPLYSLEEGIRRGVADVLRRSPHLAGPDYARVSGEKKAQ